jgi:hypothetical protein
LLLNAEVSHDLRELCSMELILALVGIFLIVSRLLHHPVVDFSSHKWVDSRVVTSRVTRPEPR